MTNDEWWRGAVIYQIYPRSFLDTNQDGVGDLCGITDRLDYVARLGVDAVWISPFFPSPMKDFGYDVSEYKNVDPMFGTLDDFQGLVTRAHALGLKVIIDLVVSHTSDQHPWFRESRSSRDNPKADWYVWVDPQPDGRPPNNWLSIFGGGAWEWDTTRRQFYLHNFLTSQPDLNYHNPEVVEALKDVAEFWMRLGVDGFRMDAVNWYFHDRELRDNPPNEGGLLPYAPESSNYVMQEHKYNKTRPEMLGFLEEMRQLFDQYGVVSLGELTAKNAVELMPTYTEKDKRLHFVYTFGLLTEECSAAHFRDVIAEVESHMESGWVCWSFSNHDVIRVVSRWRHESVPMERQAKFLLALLLSLRGSVCLYQGEELGLPEVEIAFEDLQDPFGIRLWPEFKGRDGCRTPMPWHITLPNGGFSNTKPWLPVPLMHLEKSVDVQEMKTESVLHFSRHFLEWRKQQKALVQGSLQLIDVPEPLLAFERSGDGETILAIFNVSEEIQSLDLSEYYGFISPTDPHGFEYKLAHNVLTLPGHSAFFAFVNPSQ